MGGISTNGTGSLGASNTGQAGTNTATPQPRDGVIISEGGGVPAPDIGVRAPSHSLAGTIGFPQQTTLDNDPFLNLSLSPKTANPSETERGGGASGTNPPGTHHPMPPMSKAIPSSTPIPTASRQPPGVGIGFGGLHQGDDIAGQVKRVQTLRAKAPGGQAPLPRPAVPKPLPGSTSPNRFRKAPGALKPAPQPAPATPQPQAPRAPQPPAPQQPPPRPTFSREAWRVIEGDAAGLLRRGDYGDYMDFGRDALSRDFAAAKPELEAVRDVMARTSPDRAKAFDTEIQQAFRDLDPTNPTTASARAEARLDRRGDDGVAEPVETQSEFSRIEPKVAQASSGDAPSAPIPSTPIPSNKTDWFASPERQKQWRDFEQATASLPGVTKSEAETYRILFAQEGGMEQAPGGSAVGGMLQRTLDNLVEGGFTKTIPKGTKTNQLTPRQLAETYRGYFDDVLKTVDRSQAGHKVLGELKDPLGQALFADTMFREGRGKGPRLIQKAIRSIDQSASKPDGMMGPKTFSKFRNLIDDPRSRDRLLNALVDARIADEPAERQRFELFRP